MIKIRLKNRPYGFINEEHLPDEKFEYTGIPVEPSRIAITGDYFDIADNHCAAICTMNTTLILRRYRFGDIDRCRLGNDRRKFFKSIHNIFGNGPVILFKPKFNKFFKNLKSGIRVVAITSLEEFENSIKKKVPVPMLVNAGITHWHWVLVIGIRKYENGEVYFNILDGWNKRADRYVKYTGRETFIRALKPVV